MITDIEVWEIDQQSRSGTKLEVAERVETEEILEDVLVSNPAMLMSGVTLVGRQVRVDAGCIDLLGIDETGRLVVFELKRAELTRDAVAQVLDYCSYLEKLPESELISLIVKGSGTNGTDKIEDFEDWYSNREGESVKPVRMKLVGVGIDAAASRMVEFLAENGIDISLISYHGFSRRNGTLLARQVQYAEPPRKSSVKRRDRVELLAREHRVERLWQEVKESLDDSYTTYYTSSGITYRNRKITLSDNIGATVSHSVTISGPGLLRITFYPAAIHLCYEEFKKLAETIKFIFENPPNAPQTEKVAEQCYCLVDEISWKNDKAQIIEFVYAVANAWRQRDYSSRRQPLILGEVNETRGADNQPPHVEETPADQP